MKTFPLVAPGGAAPIITLAQLQALLSDKERTSTICVHVPSAQETAAAAANTFNLTVIDGDTLYSYPLEVEGAIVDVSATPEPWWTGRSFELGSHQYLDAGSLSTPDAQQWLTHVLRVGSVFTRGN